MSKGSTLRKWSSYALIIQLFLKGIGQMNYYAMLPNYCYTLNPSASLPYSMPQQSIPPVLTILSQALKQSVFQYSSVFIPNNLPSQLNVQANSQPNEFKNEKVSMKTPQKDKLQKTLNPKKMEQEKNEQNIIVLQANGQKHSQNSAQSITHEQILSQSASASQRIEKVDVLNDNKNQKIRPKKHSFKIIVPEIDLIETASLQNLSIHHEELERKKQSLLKRQVECWNQKLNNRRDKREIRMLNN